MINNNVMDIFGLDFFFFHPLSSTPLSPFSIWNSLWGEFNIVAASPSPIPELGLELRGPGSPWTHSLAQPQGGQPTGPSLPGLWIPTKQRHRGNAGGHDHSPGSAGEGPDYSCWVTLVHLAPLCSSSLAWFSSLMLIRWAPGCFQRIPSLPETASVGLDRLHWNPRGCHGNCRTDL